MPNEEAKETAEFLAEHLECIDFKNFMETLRPATMELMEALEGKPYMS